MNKDWIYAGIFLDNESREDLEDIFTLPDGWKPYYDHMTMVFNDGSEYAQAVKNLCEKLEGKDIDLHIVGQGISDKAYAVKVVVPGGIPCANKISHITLGCSPTGKPVDSNYIENWHEIDNDFYISGKVRIVYKS